MKPADHIGSKITALRKLKNIEIVTLAEHSGLSAIQLENIESGKSIPSLGVLIRITRALGIRMGSLLDDAVKNGPVIVRSGSYAEAQSFSTKVDKNREHLTFYSLAQDKTGRHMEPFIVDIEPGTDNQLNKSSHEGEEFIYVMEGVVTIAYGTDIFELNAGDSIYLDSIVPHQVTTHSLHARILGVVYIPA